MKKIIFLIMITPNILFAEQTTPDMGGLSSFLLFPLLFVLMYFFIIRPQTKKANEHKKLINELKVNDEIITQGGLIGKIKKITDKFVIISLNVNTDATIQKNSIITSLPKGTIKQIK